MGTSKTDGRGLRQSPPSRHRRSWGGGNGLARLRGRSWCSAGRLERYCAVARGAKRSLIRSIPELYRYMYRSRVLIALVAVTTWALAVRTDIQSWANVATIAIAAADSLRYCRCFRPKILGTRRKTVDSQRLIHDP